VDRVLHLIRLGPGRIQLLFMLVRYFILRPSEICVHDVTKGKQDVYLNMFYPGSYLKEPDELRFWC